MRMSMIVVASMILILVILASLMVMSISVIMVAFSTNTPSWVVANISLMQDFDLDQVKPKRH
jgi:hypothetical protein